MITKIYIGESKLDLFEDEDIEFENSVADVSDITKNKTGFTKAFNVPATDKNNTIFKHYYEANLDGGFDARIKASGRIELDGLPLEIGKFRLNSVKMVGGKPELYSINFFGNLVNIPDAVKNDKLSALDLSAYDHTFNYANVKTGLTTNTYLSGNIVYNLLVSKQYTYDSTGAAYGSATNIASTGTGIRWYDLRPSIKLIRIIEAIESRYNLSFSRDFFGRDEFTKLFMWLNREDETGILNSIQLINLDNKGSLESEGSIVDLDEDYFNVNSVGFDLDLAVEITPSSGFESVSYRVVRYIDGVRWNTMPYGIGVRLIQFVMPIDNRKHTFYIESDSSFTFTPRIATTTKYFSGGSVFVSFLSATQSEQSLILEAQTSTLAPDIKIIDFLKGLFKSYKLVVIPQSDGTIYVNTLKDYYAEGSVINATRYVNTNDYDISRGNILNTILFNFSEPQTILNLQYKNINKIYYGDSETYLYDTDDIATRELLDGESLEIEVPFEQVVYERLTDLGDGAQTNIMYGAIIDDKLEPVNIEPHIFYNINNNITSKPIGLLNNAGTKETITSINVPSHVDSFTSPRYSTVFSNYQEEYTNDAIENTLYSNYHEEYITSIFNIKRRDFKFKASNFPLNLLRTLELNDVLKIKEDYYRIDKYELNLTTGGVMFHLVNSVFGGVAGFSTDRTTITVDYTAQSESVYVVNLGNFSTTKVDTGDGTAWVTITSTGSNIHFAFNENATDETRFMQVTVTNTDTLQEFTVTLTQLDSGITSFRYYLAKNTINFINFQ